MIKFILDTKDLELKYQSTSIKLEEFWDIILFSDSDWAGDKDTRQSMSGYAIFFMGCLVCWRSKQQKSVSFSSAEAE